METLFENVFPLLILLLVVGWWILRGVFRVVRRSVVGMDEVVEVGHLAEEQTRPSTIEPMTAIEQEMRTPDRVPDTSATPQIRDLPSIDELARINREARDQMREDMPFATDHPIAGEMTPDVIVYPQGSTEMVAEAWDRIYGQ